MPRAFSSATAESVVATVEAVFVKGGAVSPQFAADFCQLSLDQASAAMELAVDLGLLKQAGKSYQAASPLCRFLANPSQMVKAAALRLILEDYEPFIFFQQSLVRTPQASTAAQQTQVAFELVAHREEIKETLVNLGTYGQAIESAGGGQYGLRATQFDNTLARLAAACADQAGAETAIRTFIGADVEDVCDRANVIVPLADALIAARDGDGRNAVVNAGNAVESYLVAFAGRAGVNIGGATGINGKLERFDTAKALPKKLVSVGKYLGNIRNAADHGTDPEVGAAWSIRTQTGHEYVNVACSFLVSIRSRELNRRPAI
jgi:hypothetical protein